MSKKRGQKPWLKLYRYESSDFHKLSIYVRGLAAELLKYAEEDGLLVTADDEMITSLACRIGARPGDRRTLKRDVETLLADGYLVVAEGRLRIRNMAKFQAGSDDVIEGAIEGDVRQGNATTTRDRRERRAKTTPPEREADANTTREPRDSNARTELSAGNDSTPALAGARAHSEIEREREIKRESEKQNAPHTAPVAAPPVSERRPIEPPPSDRQPCDPNSAALLAELRRHPVLASIATADTSDVLAGRLMTSGRRVEWVIAAIRDFAADAALERGSGSLSSPAQLARRLRGYCDNAKPPKAVPTDGIACDAIEPERRFFSAADLPEGEPAPPGAEEALRAAFAGIGRGAGGAVAQRRPS